MVQWHRPSLDWEKRQQGSNTVLYNTSIYLSIYPSLLSLHRFLHHFPTSFFHPSFFCSSAPTSVLLSFDTLMFVLPSFPHSFGPFLQTFIDTLLLIPSFPSCIVFLMFFIPFSLDWYLHLLSFYYLLHHIMDSFIWVLFLPSLTNLLNLYPFFTIFSSFFHGFHHIYIPSLLSFFYSCIDSNIFFLICFLHWFPHVCPSFTLFLPFFLSSL